MRHDAGPPIQARPRPVWQADAACRGMDPMIFFPSEGADQTEPVSVCRACPVQEACLDYALRHRERFGIWGGLSERERERIRKGLSLPVERLCDECMNPFIVSGRSAAANRIYCSGACRATAFRKRKKVS